MCPPCRRLASLSAALAPPAPRLAKQPKRLKTRRILTEDVVLYAEGDELEGDAKVGSAGFRQLVGFRGAADTEDEPLWKIRIQLTKPGTWVPLIWGVACGAAASGNYRWPFIFCIAWLADWPIVIKWYQVPVVCI